MFYKSVSSWINIAARLLFWPLALITLAAIVLGFGIWKWQAVYHGSFALEAGPQRHSLILAIGKYPLRCCLSPRGDSVDNGGQSDLRLWINDQEMGPAHTLHEDIRNGITQGFSHWGSQVIFPLPTGVENGEATRATVVYSLRPPQTATFFIAALTLGLGWLGYQGQLRSFRERRGATISSALSRAPYIALRFLGHVSLTLCGLYILCSGYALASGWALPTTALIQWLPAAQWAARNEPFLGQALITCAGLGTAAVWLAAFALGGTPTSLREEETTTLAFFRRWTFLIVTCAFVFSISSSWSGILRPIDQQNFSFGGLIAFSDAARYLASAVDQARDGVWSVIALRRPLAAAFRSVLLFLGDYSVPAMLLVQPCLLSGSTCFAAAAIARWRGIWAAVAFLGLTFIYAQSFVGTSLTETLGLFWAFFATPFFVEAIRFRSLPHALFAFGLTVLALMTRMGSMLRSPH